MTLAEFVAARGISEILHFTTNRGLLGIFATGYVKSRKRLPDESQLEYLFLPNTDYRKDVAWIDYVNLSVSQVNKRFLAWSRRRTRTDDRLFWCILAFDPAILGHPGVIFTTTNNIYTGVKRGGGLRDFLALFEERVHQWGDYYASRTMGHGDHITTCEQAEVLYPQSLSIECLRRVYVADGETQDEVHAMLGMLGMKSVDVTVLSELFQRG
jgi:hypothetical protein